MQTNCTSAYICGQCTVVAHERYLVSHYQTIQKLSVYARITICILFNSRKGWILTEMEGILVSQQHSVSFIISDEKQCASSTLTVMKAIDTSESMLVVN